jgi:hypothetical protein
MQRQYWQTSQPHNRLSGKFLRELYAALVGGACLAQIDVRQLFGAAQCAALDLFDLSGRRISAAGLKDEQKTNDLIAFLKQFDADGKKK